MGMPQEEKQPRAEFPREEGTLRNSPCVDGLHPLTGIVSLVPYFPVDFNIPQSDTLAVAGIVFLVIAWMACRRR